MKKIRILSWSAVSSVAQAQGESLEKQRRENLEFIENLDNYYPGCEGELVDHIEFVGSRDIPSLEQACEHKEYIRLVEAITEKRKGLKLNAIVCRSRDRLGRSAALPAQIEEFALLHDVILIPRLSNRPATLDPREVRKNEGLMLMSAIEAAMAKVETRRIVERRNTGLLKRVRDQSLFPGRVPYGYRIDSRGKEHFVVVVEEHAAVVRLICELYLSGMGQMKIAEQITKRNFPAPGGLPTWHGTTIKGFLLRAKVYAGSMQLFKYTDVEDTIIFPDKIPPIISAEMAERILAELDHRENKHIPGQRRAFTGVLLCAVCGHTMRGTSKTWETLEGRKNKPVYKCDTGCPHTVIAEEIVYRTLVESVHYLHGITDLNSILDAKADERAMDSLEKQIAALDEQIAAIPKKRQKLIWLNINEKISNDDFSEMSYALNEELVAYEAERAEVAAVMEKEKTRMISLDRLNEIKASGLELLQMYKENPLLVNCWAREHFRVWVKRGADARAYIDRVEYI